MLLPTVKAPELTKDNGNTNEMIQENICCHIRIRKSNGNVVWIFLRRFGRFFFLLDDYFPVPIFTGELSSFVFPVYPYYYVCV